MPEDTDEAGRISQLAEHYRAAGTALEIRVPATDVQPERWVEVPPLRTRTQLVADTHAQAGHCGHDKLLAALREWFWWPGMHADVTQCLATCTTC